MRFKVTVRTLRGEVVAEGHFEARKEELPGPYYLRNIERIPLELEVKLDEVLPNSSD